MTRVRNTPRGYMVYWRKDASTPWMECIAFASYYAARKFAKAILS